MQISNQSEVIRGKKILIVDDDFDRLSLLSDLVACFQGEVITGSSGEEGVELIEESEIDFVFLDIMLGDMTGWDVFKKCRSILEQKKVGVLFFTSLDLAEVEADFNEVKDYTHVRLLSKSCTTNELLEAMGEMLEGA